MNDEYKRLRAQELARDALELGMTKAAFARFLNGFIWEAKMQYDAMHREGVA